MSLRIRSPRDLWAGAMFVAIGAFFLAASFARYHVGSAARMGPGYLPAVLGGVLVVLGAVLVAKSLALDGPKLAAFQFRPLLLVPLSVAAYGYLMKPGGLIVASAAAVFIGAAAGREFRWREVSIVALALAMFSHFVFVKGLTLPFPLCPGFVERCPLH